MIITHSAPPVTPSPFIQGTTSSSSESGSSTSAAAKPYVTVTVDDQYAKTAAFTNVENNKTAAQSLTAVQEAYDSQEAFETAETQAPEVSVTFGL